jgi:hypothetical protein
MNRLNVYIQQAERAALLQLAQNERRDPRDQAALLIRQRLEQLGLLPAPNPPAKENRDER